MRIVKVPWFSNATYYKFMVKLVHEVGWLHFPVNSSLVDLRNPMQAGDEVCKGGSTLLRNPGQTSPIILNILITFEGGVSRVADLLKYKNHNPSSEIVMPVNDRIQWSQYQPYYISVIRFPVMVSY